MKHKSGQRGIAATEFALMLPIWFMLLIGASDGCFYMLINERVDRISYSVTDIVAQYQAISLANLNNIILAAGQLMNPFTFGVNGVVIVTSVYKAPGQNPTICWQYSGGGTLSKPSQIGTSNGAANCSNGANATLPNGLILNDKDNIIISEVFYNFTPLFLSDTMFPVKNLYRVAVYKPRLSPLITPPT